jgi:hypothetical protein
VVREGEVVLGDEEGTAEVVVGIVTRVDLEPQHVTNVSKRVTLLGSVPMRRRVVDEAEAEVGLVEVVEDLTDVTLAVETTTVSSVNSQDTSPGTVPPVGVTIASNASNQGICQGNAQLGAVAAEGTTIASTVSSLGIFPGTARPAAVVVEVDEDAVAVAVGDLAVVDVDVVEVDFQIPGPAEGLRLQPHLRTRKSSLTNSNFV